MTDAQRAVRRAFNQRQFQVGKARARRMRQLALIEDDGADLFRPIRCRCGGQRGVWNRSAVRCLNCGREATGR